MKYITRHLPSIVALILTILAIRSIYNIIAAAVEASGQAPIF